jgi:chromosome partitioning protein
MERPMAKILAISNQKGGVGKTTTAINLACALAISGKKTLIIDLDPQANATSGLVCEHLANERLHPLVSGKDGEEILSLCRTENLTLLPSTPKLLKVEQEMSRFPDGQTRLRKWLSGFNHFQYVVIDCPPANSMLTTNALTAAGGVVIPIQCEYYAMEGLARMIETVDQVRRSTKADLEVAGVLLTMYDPQLDLSHEVAREVRSFLGDRVYRTTIPRDVSLSEATSYGLPVFAYAPRGAGALAYLELAKEVIKNG